MDHGCSTSIILKRATEFALLAKLKVSASTIAFAFPRRDLTEEDPLRAVQGARPPNSPSISHRSGSSSSEDTDCRPHGQRAAGLICPTLPNALGPDGEKHTPESTPTHDDHGSDRLPEDHEEVDVASGKRAWARLLMKVYQGCASHRRTARSIRSFIAVIEDPEEIKRRMRPHPAPSGQDQQRAAGVGHEFAQLNEVSSFMLRLEVRPSIGRVCSRSVNKHIPVAAAGKTTAVVDISCFLR